MTQEEKKLVEDCLFTVYHALSHCRENITGNCNKCELKNKRDCQAVILRTIKIAYQIILKEVK